MNDCFWIAMAVMFAVIGTICTVLLIIYVLKLKLVLSVDVSTLKDLIIWSFGGAAFSLGFCMTLRHIKSIETQANLRKEQLEEDKKRSDFDRLKKLIKCLDGDTIVALDAISELYKEADNANKNNNKGDKEIEIIQRIVLIFEFYIKKYSNVNNKHISDFDKSWEGSNVPKEPSIAIQTIIRMLFENDHDDTADSKKHKNPFRNIGRKINLTGCNLQNVDFTGLLVQDVDFGYSAMHAAKMYSNDEKSTKFIKCEFWHTYLQGANMSNTTFKNCNFIHANLTWGNMCESKFEDCQFIHTDLTACLMSKAKLQNNRFTSAILDASDIYGEDESTPVLTNQNEYSSISLCCAFVYPKGEIVEKSTINNLKGCEHDSKIYNNPENRLSRLIRYSNKKYALIAKDDRYKFSDITEKNSTLASIYEKLLKYAQEDELAGLRCDTFYRLRNELEQIYKSFPNGDNSKKN